MKSDKSPSQPGKKFDSLNDYLKKLREKYKNLKVLQLTQPSNKEELEAIKKTTCSNKSVDSKTSKSKSIILNSKEIPKKPPTQDDIPIGFISDRYL